MKAILYWTSKVLMVSVIMLLDILFSAFRPLIEKSKCELHSRFSCQWLYSVVFRCSAGYCLGKWIDWIHGETLFTPRLPAVFRVWHVQTCSIIFFFCFSTHAPTPPGPGRVKSASDNFAFPLLTRCTQWLIDCKVSGEKNMFGTKQNLARLTSIAS